MAGREERISAIYNDCWKIYKQYLATHDMRMWNENMMMLTKKYDCAYDIKGLLFWFCQQVQSLHYAYTKEVR